uniref:Uncharacterized protein n=1 Tax=Noccaea caerulescens TaxID=107243 RepID=A0A1J3E4H2_NOCCA
MVSLALSFMCGTVGRLRLGNCKRFQDICCGAWLVREYINGVAYILSWDQMLLAQVVQKQKQKQKQMDVQHIPFHMLYGAVL